MPNHVRLVLRPRQADGLGRALDEDRGTAYVSPEITAIAVSLRDSSPGIPERNVEVEKKQGIVTLTEQPKSGSLL
jgi:hypothetical protein